MWKCERGCSSVVERNLAKVDVVGSNPIIRSLKGLLMQAFFRALNANIPCMGLQ